MAATPMSAKLPLHTKVLYGVGSMSDGAQLQLVGGVLLLSYSQILGLPPQWVSLALGISVFVDAFWDPMIGDVPDNLHRRMGRRHPRLYAAALPAGLAFVGVGIAQIGRAAGREKVSQNVKN